MNAELGTAELQRTGTAPYEYEYGTTPHSSLEWDETKTSTKGCSLPRNRRMCNMGVVFFLFGQTTVGATNRVLSTGGFKIAFQRTKVVRCSLLAGPWDKISQARGTHGTDSEASA